jgi:hypothetical protein
VRSVFLCCTTVDEAFMSAELCCPLVVVEDVLPAVFLAHKEFPAPRLTRIESFVSGSFPVGSAE